MIKYNHVLKNIIFDPNSTPVVAGYSFVFEFQKDRSWEWFQASANFSNRGHVIVQRSPNLLQKKLI